MTATNPIQNNMHTPEKPVLRVLIQVYQYYGPDETIDFEFRYKPDNTGILARYTHRADPNYLRPEVLEFFATSLLVTAATELIRRYYGRRLTSVHLDRMEIKFINRPGSPAPVKDLPAWVFENSFYIRDGVIHISKKL